MARNKVGDEILVARQYKGSSGGATHGIASTGPHQSSLFFFLSLLQMLFL